MSLCTHLIERVEVVLHALDGDVLAILDALRLQNLGKRPLSLLRHEAVLCRGGADDRGRSEDDESGMRAVAGIFYENAIEATDGCVPF